MSDYYLSLRPAIPSDVELVHHWRNDPLSVKYSLSQMRVAWQDHKTWFVAQRSNIYICILTGTTSLLSYGSVGHGGMIRVEPVDFGSAGYSAELSWIVAPPFRRLGIGKRMLKACLSDHCSNITVGAKIMKQNEASIALAKSHGFELFRDGDMVGVYIKKPIGV